VGGIGGAVTLLLAKNMCHRRFILVTSLKRDGC
jgi:hypothetical protein